MKDFTDVNLYKDDVRFIEFTNNKLKSPIVEDDNDYLEDSNKIVDVLDDEPDFLSDFVDDLDRLETKLLPKSMLVPTDIKDDLLYQLQSLYYAEEYKKNKLYKNKEELIKSFANYILEKSDSHATVVGNCVSISEYKTEYKNLVFTIKTIFDELMGIEDYTLNVLDANKNELLYMVDIELPDDIDIEDLKANKKVFKKHLRTDENEHITVKFEPINSHIRIKILRLDSDKLVLFGDVLRLYNDDYSILDRYIEKDTPFLLGLNNNEEPYILDLDKETNIVIQGHSGTGKTYLMNNLLFNLLIANDYNKKKFIIFDTNKYISKLEKLPHKIKHYNNLFDTPELFLSELRKIESEMMYRIAKKDEVSDEVFVLFDELAFTLNKLADSDFNLQITETLVSIIEKSSEAKFKFVFVTQNLSALANGKVREAIKDNTSVKISMNTTLKSLHYLYDNSYVEKISKPKYCGNFLLQANGTNGLIYHLRGLTLGVNTYQNIDLLLTYLSKEWERRSGFGDKVKIKTYKFLT